MHHRGNTKNPDGDFNQACSRGPVLNSTWCPSTRIGQDPIAGLLQNINELDILVCNQIHWGNQGLRCKLCTCGTYWGRISRQSTASMRDQDKFMEGSRARDGMNKLIFHSGGKNLCCEIDYQSFGNHGHWRGVHWILNRRRNMLQQYTAILKTVIHTLLFFKGIQKRKNGSGKSLQHCGNSAKKASWSLFDRNTENLKRRRPDTSKVAVCINKCLPVSQKRFVTSFVDQADP